MPKETKPTYGYGIIRRLIGSGSQPDEDECHFDGCYSDKQMAKQIFVTWGADYPDYCVELVEIVIQKAPGVAFTDADVKRFFKPGDRYFDAQRGWVEISKTV